MFFYRSGILLNFYIMDMVCRSSHVVLSSHTYEWIHYTVIVIGEYEQSTNVFTRMANANMPYKTRIGRE